MADKQEFKKFINKVSDGIISDMAYAAMSLDGVDTDIADEAIIEIMKAGGDAIMKSNVKFDKTPKAFANLHEYRVERNKFFSSLYKKITKEYGDKVQDALKKFNAAVPAPAKEAAAPAK